MFYFTIGPSLEAFAIRLLWEPLHSIEIPRHRADADMKGNCPRERFTFVLLVLSRTP